MNTIWDGIEKPIRPFRIGIRGIDYQDSLMYFRYIIFYNQESFSRIFNEYAYFKDGSCLEIFRDRGVKYDQILLTPCFEHNVETDCVNQIMTHLSRLPEEYDYYKIQQIPRGWESYESYESNN